MPQDRLYRALGVSKTATQDEIKKAYRKLARELHPDRNPDDASAEDRFKEVNAAYEVLGDEDKRKMYDRFGDAATRPGFDANQAQAWEQWQRGGPGQGYMDLESLLGQLFGEQTRRPRRGFDTRATVQIDFRTAARGGQLDLSQPDGSALKVRIPSGARDGDVLRLRGKGRPTQGGPRGDLLLELRVGTDPQFERKGEDLHTQATLSLVEALRGGSVEVPTLDGAVKLKVKAGTQPGQKMRLRGKGITRGKRTGDLLVSLDVRLPKLTEAQLEAHSELLDQLEGLERVEETVS